MATKETLTIEAAQFQRRNRLFYWAATGVIGAVAFFAALQLFVQLRLGESATSRGATVLLLSWAPSLFYLWGLWSIRAMFAALSRKGFVFHDVITRALDQLGWALLLGAFVSLAAMPVLISLGSRILGQFAIFGAPALTIGVVGLALIAAAGMVRRGAQLEAKATTLRAVLDDFI